MIERELENTDNFVILKRQTFSAQPAFGKPAAPQLSFSTLLRGKAGADDGIRTRDLRFTKPLLYQLSYVGILPVKRPFPL